MVEHPRCGPGSLDARRALVELGRRYHLMGWVLGTSGNLSARAGDAGDRVVLTASGRHKGTLSLDDFVELSPDGTVLAAGCGARPSAEGGIHLAIYRRIPEAGAVLHVHTVASTLVSTDEEVAGGPGLLHLGGLEMVKGWGIWAEGAEAPLPLFTNHADVERIADEVEAYLEEHRAVPALIIAGHGITAWGPDIFAANRHLEVTEFLCQVARARRRATTHLSS